MKTKYLIYLGSVIPIIFWATTIICGIILGNYNHLSGLVSELGALGTTTQYIFTSGLVLSSVLSVLFTVGLYKTCKLLGLNTIPILIILLYSFSIAGAALFPMPLRLHGILGSPSILLIFSPLLSFFLWTGKGKPLNIKQMSILSFLIMSLGFLVFAPDFLSDYPGLKQRFFHIGWSVWFFNLSYSFAGLLEKRTN